MFALLRLAFLALALSTTTNPALADTRGVFVSPTTGVGVGSVWGVFIGVSEYQQKDLNLKYADKDAQALHAFFVSQFKGRIPADQFRLLTNSQATRGKVLKEVSEVLRLAQPEDLVVISLAMHGLPDASGNDLYFLSYNSDANLPEDQGISRDDLLKQIARSKARKIVLFIDACHAGAFGASPSLLAMRSASAADINRMLVSMGQAQDGIAVLSASSAAERSQEGPQFCGGHGAFTCALLTGLKGAADGDGNGLVQMRELYDHTYREVKRLTIGYQNPEIQGRYDNGLPLAATGKKPVEAMKVETAGAGASADVARLQAEMEALKGELRKKGEEPKPVAAGPSEDVIKLRQELDALKAQMSQAKAEAPKRVEIARLPSYEPPRQVGNEITGKDRMSMVLVPEGEFLYGDNNQVTWLGSFYIDKYEVSTKQYATFIAATGRKAPQFWEDITASDGEKPVVGVTWDDADAYCRYYGKRLPTEYEWEKAARGIDGRKYPWGNDEPNQSLASYDWDQMRKWRGYGTLVSVESHEGGTSPYGIYNMLGNVWEWTSSERKEVYENYTHSYKIFRGGSWTSEPRHLDIRNRNDAGHDYYSNDRGFRCAMDAK